MVTQVLRFAVIGGDERQAHLAGVLAQRGHKVNCCGLEKQIGHQRNLHPMETISEAIRDSDVIVLPLPATTDEQTVFAPLSDGVLYLAEVFADARKEQPILAGRVSKKLVEAAADRGLEVIDYFTREDLQIRNAVPTAEGAIELAMHQTKRTIFGSRCLVTGNGRIGKVLARDLAALGAQVTVSARRPCDLALIHVAGHTAVETAELANIDLSYDLIFNTIPSLIFTRQVLENIPRDTVLIDLASAPGGVDWKEAERQHITALKALSLPGKVAPLTAGEIVADTVLQILREIEPS